jgi:hypothetical protein
MARRPWVSRRDILKLAGGGLIAASVGVRQWSVPASANDAVTETGWTFQPANDGATAFETEVISPSQPFTAVCVSWRSSVRGAGLEVATSSDGHAWTGWRPLWPDPHVPPSLEGWWHSPPLFQAAQFLKFRGPSSGEPVDEIVVRTVAMEFRAPLQALPPDLIDGFIISRKGWGADESWRHEGQDPAMPIAWPPSYTDIEKVVVHHTVTETGGNDPASVVRAIYYYHAVIQGWGDIGYNYLIDWLGNIYEGRAGGPGVVGGHALQYNPGTMGIGFIGDFSGVEPTPASLDALVRLVRHRASHLDLGGLTDFIDLGDVPNFCGHGDLLDTECPGGLFHDLLPSLRGQLAGAPGPIFYPKPVLLEAPVILSFTMQPSSVAPGDLVEVRAEITNLGKHTLQTQGPEPGFTYLSGEDYLSAGFEKAAGAYRFSLETSAAASSPYPYRWGFGRPLAKDEIVEVVGYVQAGDFGSTIYRPQVIKEFSHYVYQEEEFSATVQVLHPLVLPAEPMNVPTVLYFSETGHNVQEPFASYWTNRGGLVRFGYPLTEAFYEVNQATGQELVTQYFERARFEWHPEYAGGEYEVLLGLLGVENTIGRELEAPFRPVPTPEADPEIWYFPETGHTLSYRFLLHWLEHGGLSIFGYPISEKFEERSETDGMTYLVQYFERNRFEFHPEILDVSQQILLGHLGREVLIGRGWLPGA